MEMIFKVVGLICKWLQVSQQRVNVNTMLMAENSSWDNLDT